MPEYKCQYCQHHVAISKETCSEYHLTFERLIDTFHGCSDTKNIMKVSFYRCPHCEKVSIKCDGESSDMRNIHINVLPISPAKQYPEYIPLPIRQDYEEAYAILNLSPKASATLSRRCLQGMIRNFWGIEKNTLFDEIKELKTKVDPITWEAIDAVRNIGNIGAHMEADINFIIDVDTEEAEKLIKLIEFLIGDWYIKRHNSEELFKEVKEIGDEKKTLKHSRSAHPVP